MAYMILFFLLNKGVTFVKEISEVLKNTREMSGVSIEETSKDLDIPILILTQIEDGNIGAFKDIFQLKQYIINYSKYLGLSPDEVMDSFHEYMFEVTSKIPMEEIEKAVKNKEKEESLHNKITSPYTKLASKSQDKHFIFMVILIIFLVILAFLWALKQVTTGNITTNVIEYFER